MKRSAVADRLHELQARIRRGDYSRDRVNGEIERAVEMRSCNCVCESPHFEAPACRPRVNKPHSGSSRRPLSEANQVPKAASDMAR